MSVPDVELPAVAGTAPTGTPLRQRVGTLPERSPVALFVALTRAVREASVPERVRIRAFDIIDHMASSWCLPSFEVRLEALVDCATHEPRLFGTLQPFWNELRALSASPLERAKASLSPVRS